ncbi:MAG: UvrB/UvrC motif-containing protein [Roseimicrobium sp.]
MKCDVCENDATVFLTQIVDGKMTQVNLCDSCSKEKGVTDPTGFQLADFLLGGAAQKKVQAANLEDDTVACPECGFTRSHLKKIGRMGCPECYRAFADDLDAMLRAMHKGTRHVGKGPGKPAPAVSTATAKRRSDEAQVKPVVVNVKKRLADLKVAIDKAVADERYEDAAKLRDEMRSLEVT